MEHKQQGTELFKQREFQQAIDKFMAALGQCEEEEEHESKGGDNDNDNDNDNGVNDPGDGVNDDDNDHDKAKEAPPTAPGDVELRKTCWGNIAACQFELQEYEQAAHACTKALALDGEYHKVRMRRARANDKLDTWQSLEECFKDLDTLCKVDEYKDTATRMKRQVEPRLKHKQQHETEQMMGKLKDLGNSFLGNFGMSLDNFKMNQQADGSYSMSMNQ